LGASDNRRVERKDISWPMPPLPLNERLDRIGNLIWLVFAGWWLALAHVVTAFFLAITIIGIPFAWAHLKLARLALWPIGQVVVPI